MTRSVANSRSAMSPTRKGATREASAVVPNTAPASRARELQRAREVGVERHVPGAPDHVLQEHHRAEARLEERDHCGHHPTVCCGGWAGWRASQRSGISDGARSETPRRFRLTFRRRSGLDPVGQRVLNHVLRAQVAGDLLQALPDRNRGRDLDAPATGLLRAIADHLLAIAVIGQRADALCGPGLDVIVTANIPAPLCRSWLSTSFAEAPPACPPETATTTMTGRS